MSAEHATGLDPVFVASPAIRTGTRRPNRWRRGIGQAVALNPAGAVAAAILLLIVGVTVLGPVLPLPGVDRPALTDRLVGPMSTGRDGTTHVLGTDQLGRDVLSRTIAGSRISLGVAIAAVLISGTAGTLLGLLAGYRGGVIDAVTMRLVDIQMAVPALLLAIFLLYLMGASLLNLVILLSVLGWHGYTRIVRAETMRLRSMPFVEAAVVVGCSRWRIMRCHLLPQIVPVLTVVAVLDFSTVILAEAGISFLGFGVQPPDTSWGRIIAEGQSFATTGAWWLLAAPGLVLFVTVLSVRIAANWIATLVAMRDGFRNR